MFELGLEDTETLEFCLEARGREEMEVMELCLEQPGLEVLWISIITTL